jgi:predicted nucleic acid-binding protein
MELYFGAFNKRELTKIKSRLQSLHIVNIDKQISKTAINLIEKYAKSHGLQIPDALIAASAICNQIELFTYNVKDFKFIKDVKLYID